MQLGFQQSQEATTGYTFFTEANVGIADWIESELIIAGEVSVDPYVQSFLACILFGCLVFCN